MGFCLQPSHYIYYVSTQNQKEVLYLFQKKFTFFTQLHLIDTVSDGDVLRVIDSVVKARGWHWTMIKLCCKFHILLFTKELKSLHPLYCVFKC